MKAAMKAREKETLATIRLIQAEFKRVEVDERIEIDDARALAIMDKMVKQRRCLLYTSPSPRDATLSRMPSSA